MQTIINFIIIRRIICNSWIRALHWVRDPVSLELGRVHINYSAKVFVSLLLLCRDDLAQDDVAKIHQGTKTLHIIHGYSLSWSVLGSGLSNTTQDAFWMVLR